MRVVISILFLLLYATQGSATVRIFTFHYNLPHLLEMQCKTLNKFVMDDFELIVFNDASDPTIKLEIDSVSSKYGAKCVRFEPEWHDWSSYQNTDIRNCLEKHPYVITDRRSPSLRHSRIIQYALETYGYSHDDIVVVLDGDAFPIRTISLNQMLENRDIIGSLRAGQGCEYIFPVFVAFDPRKLAVPSEFRLSWDIVHNREQDTGAYSYYYMNEHPEVKITKIPFIRGDTLSQWTKNDFEEKYLGTKAIALVEKLRGFYYEIHMDWHIFHFKGSSHHRMRAERTQRVYEFLNEILSEECPPLREIQMDTQNAPWPGDD